MNESEFREILNSDMKLWDRADDTDVTATTVTKVIDIPWGIGRQEVKLEGLTDAGARRNAVKGFGDYIRGLVEDATSDESVTARAKQSTAKDFTEDGDLVGVSGDGSTSETEEVVNQEAVETSNVFASGPEAVASRFTIIDSEITSLEDRLAELKRERVGLSAYLNAMEWDDASTHKKTPKDDPST